MNAIKRDKSMEIRRMSNDELYHHGIKGQRWGIRRFQNEDGSLTSEGRKRYGYSFEKMSNSKKKELLSSPYTEDHIRRSKEYKRMTSKIRKESNEISKNERKRMAELEDQTKDRVATDDEWNEYFNLSRKRQTVKQQIRLKYIDEYADMYLDTIGFEKTDKGREAVKKYLLKQHHFNNKAINKGVKAYGPAGRRKMAVAIVD